ncbi:hypothetical protein C9I56_02710 [Paraburkholderia caribensis]|uniref:hypothetical protein n=1 Tax=Paraburkholderia caribensis TaxID=75105 RepID=UPI000D1646F3|nr:hypothetical protein [Paraburkholderia caribensis]PTB30293.1 hypothetical protein C9I56_02710 [Paraburkholderia caribensis]
MAAADGQPPVREHACRDNLRADHYEFALFVPGRGLTLYAALRPADGGERQMLFEPLDVLQGRIDPLLLDHGCIATCWWPC